MAYMDPMGVGLVYLIYFLHECESGVRQATNHETKYFEDLNPMI